MIPSRERLKVTSEPRKIRIDSEPFVLFVGMTIFKFNYSALEYHYLHVVIINSNLSALKQSHSKQQTLCRFRCET